MSGPVACVRVIGSDAWIAGEITGGTILGYFPAWAVRVRDGGTPGTNGDMAITYVDALQEAADFYGSAKATRKVGDMVPVTAGNLVVHDAP